jgi:hypothetical protein
MRLRYSHARPHFPLVRYDIVYWGRVQTDIKPLCTDSPWARALAPWDRVRGAIGAAVLAYATGKVLVTWHHALIRGEVSISQ